MAMYAARIALNTLNPSPVALGKLKVEDLDDNFLDVCFDEVRKLYNNLGATDQVAKGSAFTDELVEILTSNIHKTRFES